MFLDPPPQRDECAAARAAVVRADEANRVEGFRVVMRANKKQLLALRLGKAARDEVKEADGAARGLGGEGLIYYLPAGRLQLVVKIVTRFLDRGRSRRGRSEIDQRLDVGERFFAGKLFPRFAVIDRFCAQT